MGIGNGQFNGTESVSGVRSENAVGKLNRERGWVEGNSEQDWGNLGNSELN